MSVLVFAKTPPASKKVVSTPISSTTLRFLDPLLYDDLRKKVPPPPHKEGSMQKYDELELVKAQTTRTEETCTVASVEATDMGFDTFFGKTLGPILNDEQKKTVSDFYQQIREEIEFFVNNIKKEYSRDRPSAYLKEIKSCGPTDSSGTYPSDHAALSKLESMVLADVFPKEKQNLKTRAIEIGNHRVQIGAQHPSDIEAGQLLADLIYAELKKSEKYQVRLKKLMADLKLKKN